MIELMRVKFDDVRYGTHYFYNSKSTLKSVVLAGRYFAHFCRANPYKQSYGLDESLEDAFQNVGQTREDESDISCRSDFIFDWYVCGHD